jgi:hypothetical protein
VLGKKRGEAERNADIDFWLAVLGREDAERVSNPDFLHGFGDGALDIWWKVQDKL